MTGVKRGKMYYRWSSAGKRLTGVKRGKMYYRWLSAGKRVAGGQARESV